jgi:hypothetical protein
MDRKPLRTTLSINDDLIEKAKSVAAQRRVPLRTVVNEALRAGLQTMAALPDAVPYHTKPHKLGLKAGRNLDNIRELLTYIESADSR